MAEVIFKGPTPPRPNPFASFGEGLSAGLMYRVERKAKEKDAEEERKRKAREAAQAWRAYERLTSPIDLSAEQAMRMGIPFSTDAEGTAELPAMTPQQRLSLLSDDEVASMSTNPVTAKLVSDIFGGGEPTKTAGIVSGDTPEGQAVGLKPGERAVLQRDASGRVLGVSSFGSQAQGGPASTLGKLKSDFDKGLISREDYVAAVRKATAPSSPLVTVSNAGETSFAKETGKLLGQRAGQYVQAGSTAANMEQSLTQLGGLLQSGTPTGSLQPAVTTLQGIAADLGLDLTGVAQAAGVQLGNLQSKEEFDRLSSALVIDGFDKFKGNLNQQEVRLAMGAFPSLGKGEEGNRLAIASLLASARLAQERAARAAQIGSKEEMQRFEAEIARSGTSQFERARQEILKSMSGQSLAVGQRVTKGGRTYRVVGFDQDGEPLVEPE